MAPFIATSIKRIHIINKCQCLVAICILNEDTFNNSCLPQKKFANKIEVAFIKFRKKYHSLNARSLLW